MFQFKTTAYRATKLSEFHNHRTVFFSLTSDRTVDMSAMLWNRVGFEKPPTTAKTRVISMGMWDSTGWVTSARADLIVTDNPQEIYGYIDQSFYQRMKLPELIENAQQMLGLTISSWNDIAAMRPEQRGIILTQPLMQMCNMKRMTEEQLLGYTRMSWEQFSKQYTSIVLNGEVLAFPVGNHKSFLLQSYYDVNPMFAVLFGEHREDGEELCWVTRFGAMNELFSPRNRTVNLYRHDDYQAIGDRLYKEIGSNEATMTLGAPELTFEKAPSILRNVKVTHYMKSTQIDLPKLTDVARSIGLRGYSTKTKAELSIMVGEKLAELPPTDMTPALMFDSTNDFNDIEVVDPALVIAAESIPPVDYYMFASRVISHAAYVPGAEASPAGRIPTDGGFPAYFGVQPLDIITPEF